MPYEMSWSSYKHFVIVTLPVPSLRKVKRCYLWSKKGRVFTLRSHDEYKMPSLTLVSRKKSDKKSD